MEKRVLIPAIIEIIFATIFCWIQLHSQVGENFYPFLWIFLGLLGLEVLLGIVLGKNDGRLGILYNTQLISYLIVTGIFVPSLLFNISGISLMIFFPIILFLVIPLCGIAKGSNLSSNIGTRWYSFRFFFIFLSLCITIIILIVMLVPEYLEWGRLIMNSGTLWIAPFILYLVGFMNFELLKSEKKKANLIINIGFWLLLIPQFFIFTERIQFWIKFIFSCYEFLILIKIIIDKKKIGEVFTNLQEYSPIHPTKGTLNKIVAFLFGVVALITSFIYIFFVLLRANGLNPSMIDVTYLLKDSMLPFYVFIGYLGNFGTYFLQDEEFFPTMESLM